MPLPGYKEIIELVKTGATIEAQERIMELRQAALDVREENVQLRERVIGLERRVAELESAPGNPCPRCGKRTWAVKTSDPDPDFYEVGGIRRAYECSECGLSESHLFMPNATGR